MSSSGQTRSADGELRPTGRLLTIPKEGERIIAPTRRPDGSYRKPIRIRAGYVPQEEVAIYQSKGALMRKAAPEPPPGAEPAVVEENKPKTKSAKRNERRKEKRRQASAAATSSLDGRDEDGDSEHHGSEELDGACNSKTVKQTTAVESILEQMRSVSVSESSARDGHNVAQAESSKQESSHSDILKRIRALKKKIRLAESSLQVNPNDTKPEQLERLHKIETWHSELKILEDQASIPAS